MATTINRGLSVVEASGRLSDRELEVLSLISEGYCSKEVANILFISKRTVDFHLGNVFVKLRVNNRVQAARVAEGLGILARNQSGFLR